MVPAEIAEQSGIDDSPKGFSCLNCRQRKIKCDRHTPCSNCAKSERQCSFIPPVRGKRKRVKPPKEGLHTKLKRYEALLRSYGVQIDPADGDESDSDSEGVSQPEIDTSKDAERRGREQTDPYGLEEVKPVLVADDGVSRYLDSALWSNLNHEFRCSNVDSLDAPMDQLNIEESDILFGAAEHHGPLPQIDLDNENLRNLHPPRNALLKLQEVFTDRIDPMMKILHLPTFWVMLMGAQENSRGLSKTTQALTQSFYFATISVLNDDECLQMLQAERSLLYKHYRQATRRALVDAAFLSTSDPMVLQAYTMFMMGVRTTYRNDTLFILSGVAIRLARKMGLHRDGTALGLPIFATEMRRRLWWHLAHMDYRAAESVGARPSADIFACDTKMPSNISDDDFGPETTIQPPERNAIMAVVVTRIRCEIADTLRKFRSPISGDIRWEVLNNSDMTLSKKDTIINHFEDHMERNYLRYCDPSLSLHNLASIQVRSSICKMKLHAHDPRRQASSGVRILQNQRDIVFTNAMKLLEYTVLVISNPSLGKYMWQISTNHLWYTILYVLIEARHRKTGPEVDRLWDVIGVVLTKYPLVLETSTGAASSALRKWILEVWDDYIDARRTAKLPDPPIPWYLDTIRQKIAPPAKALSKAKSEPDSGTLVEKPSSTTDHQPLNHHLDIPAELSNAGTYDFSDILSFEMDPDQWLQWENLIAEESGYFQFDKV